MKLVTAFVPPRLLVRRCEICGRYKPWDNRRACRRRRCQYRLAHPRVDVFWTDAVEFELTQLLTKDRKLISCST